MGIDVEIIERDGRRFVAAEQWTVQDWPETPSQRSLPMLTLKDDELFLVTDTLGNITGSLDDDSSSNMGLFCHDTRFLSRLELQIEGRSPILLSSNADKGFALTVLCANPPIKEIAPETVGIHREIVINGGFFEDIEITNYNTHPVEFTLSLSFDGDFADLFEVRGFKRQQRGQKLRALPEKLDLDSISSLGDIQSGEIAIAYLGVDDALMESRLEFTHYPPNLCQGNTAVWHLSLDSQAQCKIGYRLQMLTNQKPTVNIGVPATLSQAKATQLLDEQEWLQQITRIRSDNETFNQMLARAEKDIYVLRQTFDDCRVISAGVPWFSTLFGRDSIIAASQTLMLDPRLARSTLQVLAKYQGKRYDDWRDEQPGKILHEIRLGELARCGEIPHTPYYGTVDATPLWLMLYADYYAWTNDRAFLEQLWPNALAAMDWIDSQCQETGYLSYLRRSPRGLPNQGWKDSDNCIVNGQGKLAQGPIALCEAQAYVYAAKQRLAKIARLKKRLDLAETWEEQARDLKNRFNRDFWVDYLDFCALALDGEGKPVDSITSNPGHCLSLDIFTPEKAASVAERLLAPDLFSGWGIRTLSSDSPAYNPMGYHVGSVWPHDNAIIAVGLRSLGLVDSALEIATGIIDMTIQQPYQRPPELFCGYERAEGNAPIQYPVACSPQAWATGSIFQLLQMVLNIVPDAPSNYVHILDTTLPKFLNQLSIQNLRISSTLLDLEFERADTTTACRVVKKRGNLRVAIES
ncbi:MAG: glycogen debranching N-terminal domain-containing protein [Spirulinaceae cyanobacterium]